MTARDVTAAAAMFAAGVWVIRRASGESVAVTMGVVGLGGVAAALIGRLLESWP